MRRVNHLFPQIVDRDNLRVAFWKAAKGKRQRFEVRRFAQSLEEEIGQLQSQLQLGTFPFGQYRQFTINDPKQRLITAPSFRERVVHHAIMNVCEPWFERQYISDTYACRIGKGRNACLARAGQFSRRFSSVVHLDIRSYFDSISHDRLIRRLERIFKDERLLTLLNRIISTYRSSPGVGIPIGTLCSQQFANLYLSDLDRFVKEELRICGYVRYMDDFVLWNNDRRSLRNAVVNLDDWLHSELALQLKTISPCHGSQRGISFLGHRVFPDRLTLNRRSRHRYRARLLESTEGLGQGLISPMQYQQITTSLTAFAGGAGVRSWQARSEALNYCHRWMTTSVEDLR